MDFEALNKSVRAAAIEDGRRNAAQTDMRIKYLEVRVAEMARLIEEMRAEQTVATRRRTTKE
jgi:hypothetical protein